MLLSSVILVLQETFEAALLASVLLTISNQQWNRVAWLLIGIGGGMVLSFLYASNMREISEWFDYVGQENIPKTIIQRPSRRQTVSFRDDAKTGQAPAGF
jgi:hypothetical protein